ncbi:MAG: hypothetical protein MAG458_00787 [Nitrosopumilus sp.]|nr:hypothetical protein [Nitrosopumilus sp.]
MICLISKDSEMIFEIFSICFFRILFSEVEIKPKCRDSMFSIGFFGITPTIGILVFSKAHLHKFSCFLLPILLRIIPDIREFL